MSDVDRQVAALQEKVVKLERMVNERHAFSVLMFSCIINLWALMIDLFYRMPEGPDKEKMRKELDELRDNINLAQDRSKDTVDLLEER